MHRQLAIFTLVLLPATVIAQQRSAIDTDPRQAQLLAATNNGTASLREQVLKTRVNHDMLVGDYLKSTNSLDALDRILQSAQPVGGPRWIDDHTCQVQMELSASQVQALLMQIARDNSKHSPLEASALKARLSAWNRLTFSVVGSSVGGDAIESARPHEAIGKWSEVSDSARRSAVGQARADAAKQVMTEIGPIILAGDMHASDALARPAIADRLNNWLLHQPVTKIEFLDDLKVSVTMSITAKSLMPAFRSAMESDPAFKLSAPIDWGRTSDEFGHVPDAVSGTAWAVFLGSAATQPTVLLPLQPPDWIDQRLEADATATGGGSRLKTGRMAEASAIGKIREQFLTLHIDHDVTLGDASKIDPQLNQGVNRAMLHAHTHQVDYRPDGSVKVRVSLDLQDAWDELRSNP